ncbi:MAG TPA: D-alanyl-D-alanine carboxypeptidase [Acidobacteriota bacterium]|nr:D-alanyl-D-alanine carboxypeptidase [Acidobacteriota bacterium]
MSDSSRGGPATARPVSFRSRAPVGPAACLATLLLVALLAPARATGAPGSAGAALGGSGADSLAVLLAGPLRGAQVGLLAISQDSGDTLLAYRAGDRFIPGSNQKLYTLGAFLLDRGATARSATRVAARGKVKRSKGPGGTDEVAFRGDLVLQPCAMPDIVPLLAPGRRGLLDSLAAILRASGLRRFEGTLWIDRALFADEAPPPGWAHDDFGYSFGAPINPILANGNSVLVTAREEGGRVRLTLDPGGSPLDARDAGIAIGSPEAAGWLIPRWVFGTRTLELTGLVPRGGSVRRGVAVSDPDSAAAAWFLAALRREGVEVKKAHVAFLPADRGGDGRAANRGSRPPPFATFAFGDPPSVAGWSAVGEESARVVAALPSPTVTEEVAVVSQQSLNMEAEALLRLLDPARAGKGRREALRELTRRVAEAGIDTNDVAFVDGSGLSPQNLTTPRALVRWLSHLDSDPRSEGVFRPGLPEPGKPGTLERRFGGLPPGASLRAKTGSLTNVASLSGYLTTGAGERIVFAFLVNGARRSLASARDAEDRLVSLLARAPRERRGAVLPPARVPR